MLASVLVIAASVTVSTLVVLERVERRSEQAMMDLEADHAERVASLLQQRVVNMQKMLRATAATMPAGARRDSAAATAFLAGNPALIANFGSVFIAAVDGELLALHDGTRSVHKPMNLRDREYFSQTLAQGVPLVSSPIPGRVSNQPIMQLTMPVQGEGGVVVAVMGGTLRLASRNLFDDLTYAGTAGADRVSTIVTDARGTIISHPIRSRVMRSIDAEPGLAAMVARWEAQGRPIEPSGQALHDAGKFVSMAGVPGADWMVFRLVTDVELLGGIVQARSEALQWAAGVALFGGLITLALVAVMLGPLTKLRERALLLQDTSREIDQGWPRAGGEIGELSRALQQVLRERMQGEKAKQTLVQQMSLVLAAAPIGIAFTRGQRFELAGAEFCALLGWSYGELVGHLAHEIIASKADYQALGQRVAAAFSQGQPFLGETQFRRRDGSVFWGRILGRPVESGDAEDGAIWLLEDVTERREVRERLSWSASHDVLTRLLNRAAFEERLAQWLAASCGMPASLLWVDLDRFKQINDAAGHAAGDSVLRDVAVVLQEQIRPGDSVARLGGDEFALLLPGCVTEVALQLGERLRAAVGNIGIDHGGRRLTVGASIGVVEIPPESGTGPGSDVNGGAACADTVSYWLARADAACYDAKRAGRNAVRLAVPAGVAVLPVPHGVGSGVAA